MKNIKKEYRLLSIGLAVIKIGTVVFILNIGWELYQSFTFSTTVIYYFFLLLCCLIGIKFFNDQIEKRVDLLNEGNSKKNNLKKV